MQSQINKCEQDVSACARVCEDVPFCIVFTQSKKGEIRITKAQKKLMRGYDNFRKTNQLKHNRKKMRYDTCGVFFAPVSLVVARNPIGGLRRLR